MNQRRVLQIRDSEIVAAAEQSPLFYQVEGDTLTLADLAEAKTLGSWSIVALGTQHAEGLRPNQRLTSIRRLIASSDGSELVVAGSGGTHWLTQSSSELKIRDSGVFSTLDQLLWHPRQKQWLAAGAAPRPAGAKPGTEYIGMYTSKSSREPAAVFSIFREWPRPIPKRMAPGRRICLCRWTPPTRRSCVSFGIPIGTTRPFP